VGEDPREAEVSYQKNCRKNNQVICQVHDHRKDFKAEGSKEKVRKRKHVCSCTYVCAAWSLVLAVTLPGKRVIMNVRNVPPLSINV